jgi:cellulose synthase/poly-beta-1,6-N-acetylglucosamine synthase-like glycosyltransferase
MAPPEISVVIPAFERVAALAECLQALASQTLPASRFEVIVCDDGSRVPVRHSLASVLRAIGDRLQVRVIRQRNAGPATARNRGAAAARGRYLAFTDDDCRPEPQWLERLLRHFAIEPAVLVGGGLRTTAASDRYARATQAIMDFAYAEQERRGGMRLFGTSNIALSVAAFQRLGGFSSAFKRAAGEDYDLCARWYKNGGKVSYLPDAIVTHDHALTFRAYWLQHFSYGRGLLHVRRRLRRRGVTLRAGAVPGSFHLRLIASPVRTAGPRAIGCAFLVGVAQAATAAGVVAELLRPTAIRSAEMELLSAADSS